MAHHFSQQSFISSWLLMASYTVVCHLITRHLMDWQKIWWKQSCKQALSKAKVTKEATIETHKARFLATYRNTCHATTSRTPAELLFNRTPRTQLSLVHPCTPQHVKQSIELRVGDHKPQVCYQWWSDDLWFAPNCIREVAQRNNYQSLGSAQLHCYGRWPYTTSPYWPLFALSKQCWERWWHHNCYSNSTTMYLFARNGVGWHYSYPQRLYTHTCLLRHICTRH